MSLVERGGHVQNALLDSRKWESELTKEMQRYCDRAVGRLETCSCV